MRSFVSTRSSACLARCCSGPIPPTPCCRTGCARTLAWAGATAPNWPRRSTTCCATCVAIGSSPRAGSGPRRAGWPSWAWRPR
ncbi:Uncharacterised protein [Bordetella pertussis]|nr:Uncharacterised protein [Bordetella pertussis]